jgi:DNA end-binding protein Ku
VNVPVGLYSAIEQKDIRFHQFQEGTKKRVRNQRVVEGTKKEVPYEKVVKGYEVSKNKWVMVEPEDLEAVEPGPSRTIEIEDFVALEEIDPVYYDHPYWLVPDKGAAKAYGLLLEAMRDAGKVAIARVVLRSKEQLVAIRPAGQGLMMETMIFADEVVPPEDIEDLPSEQELKVSDRELKMARQLIDSLTTEWEPDKFHDEYREKVLDLIERKAQGEEIAVQPEAPKPARVPDLMAALEASLAAVKSDSNGDGGSSGKESSSKDGGKETKAKSSGGSAKKKTAKT